MSETQYLCSIIRCDRGVYLASWYESFNGVEEHYAFSMLAKAKHYCAQALDRERLPWRQSDPRGIWHAEVIEQNEDQ